jgi:transcriptional/translational regulatory protein YebC/TACO1
MGETGAVSWMFHRKGIIFIDPTKHNYNSIEEIIFETNAEDIISEETYIKVITSVEDYHEVEKYLE